MNNHRVIFAGTPEFALASLRALLDAGVTPVAVLTQPDRPAGRGKQLTASPVKKFAESHNIEVLQPVSLRDEESIAAIEALQADIMIVAAYGLLLPQSVLDIPKAGCLNVHASLLPRWRGASPIQAAVLAGDAETGVCLMSMTAGLDCGPVYAREVLDIGADETAGELHDRLAAAGGALLTKHLADIVAGKIAAEDQDDSNASYASKIKTSDAELHWDQPAEELARQVRAFNPVPGAFFMLDDARIKCWRAASIAGTDDEPGTVIVADADGVTVACGTGALRMESLQRPGKRPITAAEFAAQTNIAGRRL
ncbi:MAG: methionyl-tRNA formyltransferase [Woeseiaceae bacterium]